MTKQQQNWAAQHDWFANVTDAGCVVVHDETADEGYRVFGTFSAMREWAGY